MNRLLESGLVPPSKVTGARPVFGRERLPSVLRFPGHAPSSTVEFWLTTWIKASLEWIESFEIMSPNSASFNFFIWAILSQWWTSDGPLQRGGMRTSGLFWPDLLVCGTEVDWGSQKGTGRRGRGYCVGSRGGNFWVSAFFVSDTELLIGVS